MNLLFEEMFLFIKNSGLFLYVEFKRKKKSKASHTIHIDNLLSLLP